MIGTAPRAGSRTPLAVEALGYLGGALAIIAGIVAVQQLQLDITAAGELGFAGVTAAALAAGGAVTPAGREPAFARLRSVLWVLAVIAVAAFTGVLCDQILHLPGDGTATVTGAVSTCCAAVLWRQSKTAPLHLTLFCAAAVTVGSAVAWADAGLRSWGPGLAIWALSGLWAVAVERGVLIPAWAGNLAAGAGLLLGAELTMEIGAGHVLAIATVLALLAAGVAARRGWLLIFGVIGVIQVTPQTVGRYLPSSAATPLVLLAAGLVLLAAALWVARRHRRRGRGEAG
ncbi:MAG TPA: hypothetical protein VH641_01260 [Streptosporangiaceae bacterium]